MIDTEQIDWSDVTLPELIVAMKFALNFGAYVQNADPDLWRRARQYAADQLPPENVELTP